jgi:hypothetical protein
MAKLPNRPKASDIFREKGSAFFPEAPFHEVFPTIKDLTVEVRETGDGVGKGRVHTYTIDNLPGPYIDCSNPLCYRGGFSIQSILRDMVSKGETERETTVKCRGYEGSPKGRKRYRDCWNRFSIKVSLEYTEE